MVAAAMGIELRQVETQVDGDLDFRGTIGIDPRRRSDISAFGPPFASTPMLPRTGFSDWPRFPCAQ
jgi:hypothetical protein